MTHKTPGRSEFGSQIRKSPYFAATQRWGCTGYSVYNHMYIPRSFGDAQANFWNLVNSAILCDVAVERQVEITGPDAARFVQLLTPRNLAKCKIGQCKYVFITSAEGGIINDPVLLRLGENHFWLSLADSDVLLWAKGVQIHSGMDVTIREPDVSPLQLQGPKSCDIMCAVFGDWVQDLRYFRFVEHDFNGIPLVISRTGWSSELGYEIFLRDSGHGDFLWEKLMEIGAPLGLHVGHTSTIRRIEGGMLSYITDMTIENNPYELGWERLVNLDIEADFIGKQALRKIQETGVTQLFIGVEIEGEPLPHPNGQHWPVFIGENNVGKVTSAVYSPRLKRNIGLAMLQIDHTELGTRAVAQTPFGVLNLTVVPKPFYDPEKKLASA
ncbi:MAG: glycine cleavage system aminomethyltransferase T [Cellvibrionaceae bacterium]|jgi:glycine cleavage system aminomethyltransferase T